MSVKNCVVCWWISEGALEEGKIDRTWNQWWKICKKHEHLIVPQPEETDIVQTEFPKSNNQFIKAENFQDQEIPLTFVGFEKKHNEDRTIKGQTRSWKESLKYVLRYSYPEFAVDPLTAEKRLGKDGKPFQNKNYDPKYPQGYTVVFHFEEGQFETGSLPLWNAFCMVRPAPGDTLIIGKTGKDKETKWKVKKITKDAMQASINQRNAEEVPTIQIGEEDESVPF